MFSIFCDSMLIFFNRVKTWPCQSKLYFREEISRVDDRSHVVFCLDVPHNKQDMCIVMVQHPVSVVPYLRLFVFLIFPQMSQKLTVKLSVDIPTQSQTLWMVYFLSSGITLCTFPNIYSHPKCVLSSTHSWSLKSRKDNHYSCFSLKLAHEKPHLTVGFSCSFIEPETKFNADSCSLTSTIYTFIEA